MKKGQSSQYDKIFKENIEVVIPGLMRKVLGIQVVTSEELPDDILHTKERKPDVLKKITDVQGNVFVLQIEFQLADEPEMVYRMAEYCIMLQRKYRLPVNQYVIFIGRGTPKMPTQLVSERLSFNFPLIAFAELDYHIFLNSDRPEEVVLRILADFKQEETDDFTVQIVQRIRETTEGDFALRRYFQQLRILAQLRNLETDLKDTAMDSLDKYVSMERDAFYMVGKERAEEKVVRNLLNKLAFSTEQAADIAGVSVEFVEKVKQKISAGK